MERLPYCVGCLELEAKMNAKIVRISDYAPHDRPAPTEPATITILPIIRVEHPPEPRRASPSERLRKLRSPSVFLDKPCDT